MILYVNGDSHTAAAEAVNPHAFAEDDGQYFYMGRAPHPDNIAVSWGKLLSTALRAGFHCGAESASSNTRIIRTTREWLDSQGYDQDLLVIIQWSTWEREEWLHNGTYYQVNGSGIDMVPQELQEKYRHFVAGIDWQAKTTQAHKDIWEFHQELESKNIRHIFFNGNNDFGPLKDRQDWGASYIGPYDPKMTYNNLIQAQGIQTVAPNSWHFGRDGHSYFHRFMLQYIINNKLI
ncbi:hypothetical protein UFOVP328_134 [uncultured Caudovirales phage]|uniref:Uncharacterized protein n=1 Tax=uncultured Caudovirales phage TaxID=2100421 RepID=A0A6J5LYV3_9CAUD|nr:hypothetical protein UFOVP328_134 [uncultured Caudovirales phage]